MELSTLGQRAFLSSGPRSETLAFLLCREIRHRRNQQHLLSLAIAGNFCRLGQNRAGRIHFRRKSESLHHSHQEAQRPTKERATLFVPATATRQQTRTHTVSASAANES